MNDKLKPCPFCGGEANWYISAYNSKTRWIICKNCHYTIQTNSKEEFLKAIETWNRRVNDNDTL